MAWSLLICEGRSYDLMVRAAEFALAMAQTTGVQAVFEKEESYSPWRHLLAPLQQVALRALALDFQDANRNVAFMYEQAFELKQSDSRDLEAWRLAGQKLREGQPRSIWVRSGDSIPPRPPADTWLFVLSHGAQVHPETVSSYQRACGFAPTSAAVEALPLAVNPVFLAPSQPALRSHVLVIGDGNIDSDLERVAAILLCGAEHIVFFDPYHALADYVGGSRPALPPNVRYLEGCGPSQRAAAFSTCSVAVVATKACHVDNHFLWEAAAMGLAPLGHYLLEPGAWTYRALQQAYLAHTSSIAMSLPVPALADWREVTKQLLGVAAPSDRQEPTRAYDLEPHQVTVISHLSVMPKNAGAANAFLLICPGPDAVWDTMLQQKLAPYGEIFVDTTENAEIFVPLISHHFSQKVRACSDVAALLQKLLSSAAAIHLTVFHFLDSNSRIASTHATLQGLQERWQTPGKTAATLLPNIVVHLNKRMEKSGLSRRQIGVSVATDAISSGLDLDARGRYNIRWLGRQQPASERGRIYLYPFAHEVGFDRDEVDYPSLPTLLAQNHIDLMCSIDPFMVGGISARALWAKKSIPVVGMLHSIHSAHGTTEVIYNLLSSQTYSYDAIISPSQCGAQAYGKLLESVSDWLAPRMAAAPKYHGQLEVIPYGIDASFYHGLHRASCRGALNLPATSIVLLSLGRYSKQEKADLLPLLLAVRTLREHGHDVILVLAGGRGKDSYPEHIRHVAHVLEIGQHVRVYESIAPDDKVLMYGAADIFVSISDNIQETYGLTLLEAMAASRCVVASEWNGYREIVRHNQSGILIPTYAAAIPPELEQVQRIAEGIFGYGHRDLHETVAVDLPALVAALESLIKNPERRTAFGETGKQICSSEYDQIKQAKKTGDFILSLIGAASRTPWTPNPGLQPFADPVGQRFAHYPSEGVLGDDAQLAVGRDYADKRGVLGIAKILELNSRPEQQLLLTLTEQALDHPGITVKELCSRGTSREYSEDAIRLRILRCLKYGILVLVQQP